MAVPIYKSDDQQRAVLTSKWVLADNLNSGLLKKIGQSKLFGFTRDGYHYFSMREILSATEKYLTEK
jgi:hypothetical protein